MFIFLQVFLNVRNRREVNNRVGVNRRGVGRHREVRNDRNEERVVRVLRRNPQIGLRDVAAQLNMSLSTAHRLKNDAGFHDYHYTKTHKLEPRHVVARLAFSRRARRTWIRHPRFFENTLFTDECLFSRKGIVNRRNLHYYDTENPRLIREDNFQVNILLLFMAFLAGLKELLRALGRYFAH